MKGGRRGGSESFFLFKTTNKTNLLKWCFRGAWGNFRIISQRQERNNWNYFEAQEKAVINQSFSERMKCTKWTYRNDLEGGGVVGGDPPYHFPWNQGGWGCCLVVGLSRRFLKISLTPWFCKNFPFSRTPPYGFGWFSPKILKIFRKLFDNKNMVKPFKGKATYICNAW